LYDYTLPGGLPSGSRTAWSQLPLRPLVHGPLTPFSYSVLAEIAGRAWYLYFDRLGFDPMPRARVLRQYAGQAYLNLTLSAQRDVEGAAVEPVTLRVNGQPFPVTHWEKPGFLAGVRAGFAQNKIAALNKSLTAEQTALTQQAQAWYAKTLEMRWVQAEVLQIMEEIEVIGSRAFLPFFATCHQLDLAYNQLIRWTAERTPFPANFALLEAAIGQSTGLLETDLAAALMHLGDRARANPTVVEWLEAAEYTNWPNTLPDPTFVTELATLLHRYGHRAVAEGEIRTPRWRDDPTALLQRIAAVAQAEQRPRSESATAEGRERLLASVESQRGKEAQSVLEKIPALRLLQSQALHALAYILAGTRQWAFGAARDALADQRLTVPDDLFFFELEEIKQMMTGEWNVSDRAEIQRTCVKRRADFAEWQTATPAELLIGESEATASAKLSPNTPNTLGGS